jgi:hypothetical protein
MGNPNESNVPEPVRAAHLTVTLRSEIESYVRDWNICIIFVSALLVKGRSVPVLEMHAAVQIEPAALDSAIMRSFAR